MGCDRNHVFAYFSLPAMRRAAEESPAREVRIVSGRDVVQAGVHGIISKWRRLGVRPTVQVHLQAKRIERASESRANHRSLVRYNAS